MSELLVRRSGLSALAGLGLFCALTCPARAGDEKGAKAPEIIRSARSGPWSAPATWAGGKVPGAGARVLIRTGHRVVYDVRSDRVIRAIDVAGVLEFATDKDTR